MKRFFVVLILCLLVCSIFVSGGCGGSSFTITASASDGGRVMPESASVGKNSDCRIDINPANYHYIEDVLVDGSSIGAVTSYVFTNVQASHKLSASFAHTLYTIHVEVGPNGKISPGADQSIDTHRTLNFTISANPGYHIADVLVDGSSCGAIGAYTFGNVTSDRTISASFAADIASKPAPPPPEPSVVVTRTGSKYHLASCHYVNLPDQWGLRTLTVSQAKAEGYTPCSVCQPPS